MQTRGEFLVGVTFNPSNNKTVDEIKRKAADLIDLIADVQEDRIHTWPTEAINPATHQTQADEVLFCTEKAMRCFEEGAMWAVKAATKGSPN